MAQNARKEQQVSFGTELRRHREAAGLTQEELAERAGLAAAAISALERGTRQRPYPHTVDALATALHLSGDERLALRAAVPKRGMTQHPLQVARILQSRDHSRQLLATKLFIPRARSKLVARPRLDAQLEAGLAHPLTLISAPPGSGKTTLLGDCAQRHAASGQYGIAWVSLDASDSDLRTFVHYLTAALRTVTPAAGQGTLALLQSPQPFPPEALLRPLLNDLATLPCELVVVLDDYHLIDSPSVHQALQFMLDHLPPTLHLVIATRVDPPLPLARLRVRGQLTEVRGADLRFTAGEAAEFLRRVMGLDLAEADMAALEARTEGWIAGLQLAACSLQGRDDSAAFVAAFSGSHHYVLDYLVEEVLQRQPSEVRQFLLHTSILDRLTAPLCDALLEQPGSTSMLRRLEQDNLFLMPLDAAHTWYRYHHLFADVLRQRLREEQPELLPVLYGRASAWLEHHGSQTEAVRMALAAADIERAADLIEDASEAMLLRGEMVTLLNWLGALPPTLIRTRPRLCVAEAWALAVWFDDRFNEAEARLADAERLVPGHQAAALPSTLDERILGDVAAIRATMAAKRGDVPGMIAHSREALRLVPAGNRALRGLAGLNLGIAYRVSGEVAAAREALAEAATLKQRGGNIFVTVLALVNLARLDMLEGRLHQAAARLQQAMEVASTPDGTPLPPAGIAHLRLADVLYQWGDLTAATDHLARGFELGQDWSVAETTIDAYLTLARVHQARGDAEAARAAIVEAERRASEQEPGHLVAQVSTVRAWLSLAQGSLHLAAHWADARQADLAAAGEPGFRSHAAYIMVARVRIAQGRVEQALSLLERLLAAAQTGGLYGRMIEVFVLQATALQAQSDPSAALLALQRALTLAEPEGYVRCFVDEGAPMATVLRQAQARGVAGHYVDTLLAAFGAATGPAAKSPLPVHEALTPRELEILQLVAAGLSVDEIAERAIIAPGTVRNHLKSIYGKLDAHSRLQAVERARALHLL